LSRPSVPSVLLLGLVLFAGCRPAPVPTTLDRLARFAAGDEATFQIHYSEGDEALIPELTVALRLARQRVQRWGGLPYGVDVLLHPDHDALERAVQQHGYPWLRAWAQHGTIHLQSPQTWGIPWGEQLRELLIHELTHVAMYQAIGGPTDWMTRELPLWFREGMASVTAEQGYRRPSEAEVFAAWRRAPHLDPLRPDAETLRTHKDLVYGAGHWAFARLLERAGGTEPGTCLVCRLLARIRNGEPFERAFEAVWGLSEEAFLQGFLAQGAGAV